MQKAGIGAVAELPPIPANLDEVPQLEKTTLGAWGRKLPVGVIAGGTLHREFSFRPYRTAEERQIEAIRRENKGMGMAEFLVEVLALMLRQIGPHDFSNFGPSEKKVVLYSTYVADIFALWTWMRIEALDKNVRFRINCQVCGHEWRPEADLEETELKVAPSVESLTWRHQLRHGIKMGETVHHELLLQPPRWGVLTNRQGNRKNATSDLKVRATLGSIRQVGDGSRSPTERDLEDLTKYDLEFLQRSIDDHNPGLEMDMEAECPHCGQLNRFGRDWSWDFFFTASSL